MINNKSYIINKGFELKGYFIPPFVLEMGKLIRIYIPNFSDKNETMGFDFAQELVLFFKKEQINENLKISEPISYIKIYFQNQLMSRLHTVTVYKYLTRKLKIESKKAIEILGEIGLDKEDKINEISNFASKALAINELLMRKNICFFDYYGLGPTDVEALNKLLYRQLVNGKCAIGFDNLQYIEESEPFVNFDRIIIKKNL